jgi:hypothetical protein
MYKHQYIDKLGESSANVHTIFGTAMHEVIQHYLTVFYGVSKKQANELNLDKMLLSKLREEFVKEKEKMARTSNKFQARCVYNIELLALNAEAFQKEELDPLKEEQLIQKISLEEKALR